MWNFKDFRTLVYIFFYFLLWYFTLHLFWLYLCAPEYCTLCMELFWHMQHTTSTCYTNFMVSLRLASHLILFNLMTSFSPWVSPLTYIHGMDNHLKITNMFVLSLYIIITYLQHVRCSVEMRRMFCITFFCIKLFRHTICSILHAGCMLCQCYVERYNFGETAKRWPTG